MTLRTNMIFLIMAIAPIFLSAPIFSFPLNASNETTSTNSTNNQTDNGVNSTIPSSNSTNSTAPKRYIIKLKNNSADVKKLDVDSLLPMTATADGANVLSHKFDDSEEFKGFSGTFTDSFIASLLEKHSDVVEYVEEDGKMSIVGEQSNPPSWGLSRISNQKPSRGATYRYPDSAGEGVEVWVIDTGVQDSHTDFEGRAKLVKSFIQGEQAADLNGHGTHCSGTIGSKTYGVAKKASVFGLKVLGADGSGSFSDIIAAIQHVTKNAKPGKTVISMSLGGSFSRSVNDACNAAVNAGVVVIVAAGNERADACKTSPASASKVFTVGATDSRDKVASFSNFGKCVKILAPGVDITSLWMGQDGATNKISGTSMATPHVAGVAALLMSQKNYQSPKEVYDDLLKYTVKIQRAPSQTTTSLLNMSGILQ